LKDKILTVWDKKGNSIYPAESTIYWSGYSKEDNINTVPKYLEDNADQLRARYLAFIHELGELNFSGKRLVNHLEVDEDFSFWWMTLLAEKSYLKSPRIFDCLRLLALDKQLNEIKPDTLRLVSDDRTLAKAIKKCTESKGIHFQWDKVFKSNQGKGVKSLYRRLPAILRAFVYFVRHIINRWPLKKSQPNKWFSGGNSIFFFSYFVHLDSQSCEKGKFYSHQWDILPYKLYDEGKKLNFIHHFLYSPDMPDTKTGIRWVAKFNQESESQGLHSFLDSWLSVSLCWNALMDYFRLSIKMRFLKPMMRKSLKQLPYHWLWPLLEKDWVDSIHGVTAIQNTLWLKLYDRAIGSLPKQPLGLYLLEGQCWERAFIHYWRKNGHGRLIGVSHSTVAYWYLMYFNDLQTLNSDAKYTIPKPDIIAVNGKAMRNIMENAGYQPEDLIDVEALRYLHLNKIIKKYKSHSVAMANNKLLVLGDYKPNITKSLLLLLNQLDKSLLLKYYILFKNHPAVDPINKELYPNLFLHETNLHLSKLLPTVDVVLSSINTAAAIESFAAGLPVITVLDNYSFNASPLRVENGAIFVSTSLELKNEMETLLNKSSGQMKNDYFWVDSELPRWRSLLIDN
jgi:surface carbohydrate biosynthesis protein (TIGR04326 family)